MIKKKDLTIEEYKETLLDEIEDDEIEDDEIEDDEIEKSEVFQEEEESTNKQFNKSKNNKNKSSKNDNFEEIKQPRKNNKISLIINIVFIILIIGMLMITTDVICVARYNKGPFFAIKTKTYKDGGTKVYYGLGYKVIKYNQLEGRRGIEIGTWSLKYETEPFEISAVDLAIEFTNKPQKSYTKYYKKFLKVTGTLVSKDEKTNTLTLAYIDEDKKYNLDIVCKMAEDFSLPEETLEQITIIGTGNDYKLRLENTNQMLYINDCIIKQ